MPEMMMLPGDSGLLLPTKLIQKIEMGSGSKCSTSVAVTGGGIPSDYTWSTIIVTVACAVMVVVSAMKGVRRFSFALTYTNLWFIFGKRGRLRVRVHSFTSTNGSNCFVTTSGEFSAELVKEEEEELLEKQLDLNFEHQPDAGMGPTAGSRAGCIVGTEMVFIYNATTSVFSSGSFARFPQRKSYREALCTPVTATSSSNLMKEETVSRRARAVRAAGESPEWQLGVLRSRDDNDDEFCTRNVLVPDWALGLLEPVEIVRWLSSNSSSRSAFPSLHHPRRSVGPSSPMKTHYSWDSLLRLRLAGAEEGRCPVSSGDETIVYPSAVVAGATYRASLRKNVVKFWDNSTRRAVLSLPTTTTGDTSLSSFDVGWEKDAVAVGSSDGELFFWDLERVQCVTSVRAHKGPIGSVHFNAADQLDQENSFLTAGRVAEESMSRVLLWDSRMLNVVAGSSGAGSRFRLVEDLKFKNYGVVARDENSRVSIHDIRMLSSSAVFTLSEEEVNSIEFEGQYQCQGSVEVGLFGHEEKWWDFNSMDDSSEEEADFEDYWGTIVEEIVKSPSVLSRCFNALSSVISR